MRLIPQACFQIAGRRGEIRLEQRVQMLTQCLFARPAVDSRRSAIPITDYAGRVGEACGVASEFEQLRTFTHRAGSGRIDHGWVRGAGVAVAAAGLRARISSTLPVANVK